MNDVPMMKACALPVRLLICIWLLVLTNGCATYHVWENNLRYRDYTTEFVQHDRKSIYSLDGLSFGTVFEEGAEWREYLFAEVLYGKDRVFRILVPINVSQGMEPPDLSSRSEWNGPRVQILETVKHNESSIAAQVVFMPYGACSVEGLMWKLNHEFPTLDISEYGPHLIIVADEFSGEDVVYFRNSDASNDGLSQWMALPTKQDVHWKKRNMILSSFRKLPYILTVPFDLLTLPIQCVLFYMTLNSC